MKSFIAIFIVITLIYLATNTAEQLMNIWVWFAICFAIGLFFGSLKIED